jgi:hypothetical protein
LHWAAVSGCAKRWLTVEGCGAPSLLAGMEM